ncbi:MAG: hypothetical protein NTW86_15255 [Candidatus Sumerlaeota bacterium]|nr:hypothetical protein [Candidatus Sumerlaeota bacterium]
MNKSNVVTLAVGIASDLRVDRQHLRISGVSIMTTGELLGHKLWIDETTLNSVEQLGNAAPNGIVSRLDHPAANEGAAKTIGKLVRFRRRDNRTIGDLELLKTARSAPGGNLTDFVLALAEEAPELFGLSIVFDRSPTDENQFLMEHVGAKGFVSPDPANTSNFRHVRLKVLFACDVVSVPAANPGGLLSATFGGEAAAGEAKSSGPNETEILEYIISEATERGLSAEVMKRCMHACPRSKEEVRVCLSLTMVTMRLQGLL